MRTDLHLSLIIFSSVDFRMHVETVRRPYFPWIIRGNAQPVSDLHGSLPDLPYVSRQQLSHHLLSSPQCTLFIPLSLCIWTRVVHSLLLELVALVQRSLLKWQLVLSCVCISFLFPSDGTLMVVQWRLLLCHLPWVQEMWASHMFPHFHDL